MGKLKQKMIEEQDSILNIMEDVMMFGDFHDSTTFTYLVVNKMLSDGIKLHPEHVEFMRETIKGMSDDYHITERAWTD